MLTVTLIDSWDDVLKAAVISATAALESLTRTPDGNISIKLVDDREISALNKEYSGNAYPTDVLTFNYAEAGETDGELGDIAISLETAQRQADEGKIGLPDEVALLSVHGILHVLGHDHQDKQGQQTVAKLQSKILEAAGIKQRGFSWE